MTHQAASLGSFFSFLKNKSLPSVGNGRIFLLLLADPNLPICLFLSSVTTYHPSQSCGSVCPVPILVPWSCSFTSVPVLKGCLSTSGFPPLKSFKLCRIYFTHTNELKDSCLLGTPNICMELDKVLSHGKKHPQMESLSVKVELLLSPLWKRCLLASYLKMHFPPSIYFKDHWGFNIFLTLAICSLGLKHTEVVRGGGCQMLFPSGLRWKYHCLLFSHSSAS